MKRLFLLTVMLPVVPLSPAAAQIPDGFEIVQITNDPDHDSWARINNCGQIIFSKRINQSAALEEIFLYDRFSSQKVTDVTS